MKYELKKEKNEKITVFHVLLFLVYVWQTTGVLILIGYLITGKLNPILWF